MIEKIKNTVNEFVKAEVEVLYLKFQPDIEKYKQACDNIQLLSTFRKSFNVSRVVKSRSDDYYKEYESVTPFSPRHLYKISHYRHKKYKNVWVAYVSKTNPREESISSAFFIIEKDKKILIAKHYIYSKYKSGGLEYAWEPLCGTKGLTFESLDEFVATHRFKDPVDDETSMKIYLEDKACIGIYNHTDDQNDAKYDIILSEGRWDPALIKEVRKIIGLGFGEATALIESAPVLIEEGVNKDKAEEIKKRLEATDAIAEIIGPEIYCSNFKTTMENIGEIKKTKVQRAITLDEYKTIAEELKANIETPLEKVANGRELAKTVVAELREQSEVWYSQIPESQDPYESYRTQFITWQNDADEEMEWMDIDMFDYRAQRIKFLLLEVEKHQIPIEGELLKTIKTLTGHGHYIVNEKASEMLRKGDVGQMLNEFCTLALSDNEKESSDAICNFSKLELTKADFLKFDKELVQKIIEMMQQKINIHEDNIFYLYKILNGLMNAYPKECVVLQNVMTEAVKTIVSYEDFEFMLYIMRQTIKALELWDKETLVKLGTYVAKITEREFTAGDAFGEENLRPALEAFFPLADNPYLNEVLKSIS